MQNAIINLFCLLIAGCGLAIIVGLTALFWCDAVVPVWRSTFPQYMRGDSYHGS